MPVVSRDTTVDLGARQPMEQADPLLRAQRATLAHSDTAAKDLFTLPAGAQIVGFIINVTTAFDDSGGSDIIAIGDGDTAARFVADFDCGSVGLTLEPSADEAAMSAETVVEGKYTPGTGATAGAATIVCLYIEPGS
jgi:hypothetical protein